MNENEKAVITAMKDAANLVAKNYPFISGGDAFASTVFYNVNSSYSAPDYQKMNTLNVLGYHIQRDILKYTKSCFSEERLKQYLDPKCIALAGKGGTVSAITGYAVEPITEEKEREQLALRKI